MCGLAFIFVHLPYISAMCIDYGCQTHAVHIRQNNKKRKRKEGEKKQKTNLYSLGNELPGAHFISVILFLTN